MTDRTRRRPARLAALPLLFAAACSQATPTWTATPASALDDAATQKLQRAEQARDALGRQLLGELSAALGEGGPQKGIEVCKQRAPAIARDVAAETGVRIGRTSFRLRNPDNAAPAWAADAIAARADAPATFTSAAGGLGALFPIRLQPQCVMCHGDPAQLAPAVRDALGAAYPSDRATGFAPGDLRGWFWVEVD